ncbi:MAG: FKBP-type peptidyl-prolyl cis-trans isomerase, partial [Pseudomonadota bacterium]
MKKPILCALLALSIPFVLSTCSKKQAETPAVPDTAKESTMSEDLIIKRQWPNAIKTPTGLMYVVVKQGQGEKPKKGSMVTAHYTGTLINGTKFDSSVDRGQPFQFAVGMGQVIPGWDEAFLDMKKGEKRTLIIPYNLAYGDAGFPPVIPSKA